MNSTLFLTNVIAQLRILLTSSMELQFSEDGQQQALFRSMRSCRINFNEVAPTLKITKVRLGQLEKRDQTLMLN
jgi:hypothetical protein